VKRLVSCAESRKLDIATQKLFELDALFLMEKASLRMWDCLLRHIESSPSLSSKGRDVKILALCGKGNNAGDTLAMLRHARSAGFTTLQAIISSQTLSPSAEVQKGFIQTAGIPCFTWGDLNEEERLCLYAEADIVLDGILGIGIQGAARGEALEMIELTTKLRNSESAKFSKNTATPKTSAASDKKDRALVVSVDIPSGLGDTWTKLFPAVYSDLSLCLEPIKEICFAPSARSHCGSIVNAGEIFPRDLIMNAGTNSLLEESDLESLLDPISPESYKMSRGRLAIFAGSLGSAGAAFLCVKAAFAAGAGYIYLYVDKDLYPLLASSAESIILRPWGADTEFPDCDIVLAGPGWGTGEERIRVLQTLGACEDRPIILDADAIRLFAKQPGLCNSFTSPCALTPHPGEYRDLGKSLGIRDEEPFPLFIDKLAKSVNALMLAKSHITWIQGKNARFVWEGMTPELGVAGSGDVLAGLFAGLLARKIARLREIGKKKALSRQDIERSMEEAACAAVIAHGSAGRRLAEQSGWFNASQLIEACALVLHNNNNRKGMDR
jgi:Predicted sugar kinase